MLFGEVKKKKKKSRGSVFWIISVSEPMILYEHVIYILGNKVVFTTES